ncbi:hypothetical protein [Sinomicrobium soli]|uniref:hypothetical protein n=1 Tax=Sinomicrobium sp. N-1-3-6 TaxID=2219864 RepID=UPI000DCCFC69|nr:hypothetical protein [Sinomicrobium sp. N-1-3-6]RAV29324.1 hypothetical protein DN748_09065 [Sinomicrobium sp. N-1-3-6]
MVLHRVNLEHKLKQYRDRKSRTPDLLKQVERILEEEDRRNRHITEKLARGSSQSHTLDFEKLATDRIFHISHIKQVCTDYRLRFLDTRYFKGTFPEEAIAEIKRLEKQHGTTLSGFKIVAPAGLFRLENADDPLLFVPLGNNYYYLIHKWGNDLHPLRKWLMLPFKNLFNLFILMVVISLGITAITPLRLFTPHPDASHFWLLFFFILKSLCGITLFYAFALGKNFNGLVWNSKYYN